MAPKTDIRQTKYIVLAEVLRAQIVTGNLRPGDRLPSFGEMRTQFGASLATVDRALGILEKDGLIVRVNGSGVFVTEPADPAAKGDAEKPLLGLLLPNCQGHFFSQIIEGVEDECQAAGYHLLVANSRGDHDLETQLIRQLSLQTVGLCIMACGTGNQSAFAGLLERKVPFVLLDRYVEGLRVPVVATDNERGGYLATRHLLESGCQQVYTVGESSERASSLRERVLGYRKALTEAGVPFDATLVRQADDDPTRVAYTFTREILENAANKAKDRIGIFALNDLSAQGCYMAIKERGLKIPDDVAVVGFDDTIASLFDPPLTSVHQDLPAMGREGVRQLLELMRTGSAVKPRNLRLQPELVIRNSSDTRSDFCSISQMLRPAQTPERLRTPLAPLAGV